MAKTRDILGINGRSAFFLYQNKKASRKIADSKELTKSFLKRHKIPQPKIIGIVGSRKEIEELDWGQFADGFVIKPVEGLGGDGILVIKKQLKNKEEYLLMDGRKVSVEDLKLHAGDIVEGRYSRNNVPDKALVEERIKIHPKFKKIAVGGTPDVRVIVFNRVPVMAMLRVPTAESRGKSNLHQGAIGLGVDMATGITTYGVYHGQKIKHFPETGMKVNGIAIPYWRQVLEAAVKIQFRRPGLAYFGADVLIDKDKGPMVIEINDQPGLGIQLANMAGLRRRLDRVEGLEIDTEEKGVKVARALFAAKFAQRVGMVAGDKQMIGIFETVKVKPHKGKRIEVRTKIDTGARSSSIDSGLAEELGLLKPQHVLWEKKYKSALGSEMRKVIELNFKLRGIKVKARASVTDRHGLRRKVIIGRRDLKQFVVDPGLVRTRK